MNKQEAIEKIEKLEGLTIKDKDFNLDIEMIPKGDVLEIIEQIDELEKPVVPQFVADFISSEQRSCSALSEAIDNMDMRDEGEVTSWFYDNSEIFAKAWLYGYEIEKDKLYTVEIPNPNSVGGKTVLSKQQSTGKLILEMLNSDINKPKYLHLTESEIKEDFEWAWQFAEEVNNNDD